jgi:hypothetical protein
VNTAIHAVLRSKLTLKSDPVGRISSYTTGILSILYEKRFCTTPDLLTNHPCLNYLILYRCKDSNFSKADWKNLLAIYQFNKAAYGGVIRRKILDVT